MNMQGCSNGLDTRASFYASEFVQRHRSKQMTNHAIDLKKKLLIEYVSVSQSDRLTLCPPESTNKD